MPIDTDTRSSSTTPEDANLSYEDALAQLETLVELMESGALPLEQLSAHYQQGSRLLARCQRSLQTVEAQVKLLADGVATPLVLE